MAGRMKRTQVLFPEEQYRRLKREAAARGCSMGQLVREAVDNVYVLCSEHHAREEIARRLISMSLPVAEWPQMEEEITRGRLDG